MKVLLIIRPQSEETAALGAALKAGLERDGFTADTCLWSSAGTAAGQPLALREYLAAFSLGGDGTVLYTARRAAPYDIPVLPVNMGTLGFIAAVTPGDARAVFDDWRAGRAAESGRLMLEVRVERRGAAVFSEICLNDAVVSADGIAKTIFLDASFIRERETADIASYRSDGLILSTPTGSTAYSASAGGPILDPETENLVLNPICPFTLLHRPLVIPVDGTLCVTIPDRQRAGVILTIDGQVTFALLPGDRVLARKAPFKARLIASGRAAFYRALHTKLAWPKPEKLG